MDWKEFFRPTWPKLILLFVIISFKYMLPEIGLLLHPKYEWYGFIIFDPVAWLISKSLNEFLSRISPFLSLLIRIPTGFVIVFLDLLWNYLISSSIISLFIKILSPETNQKIPKTSQKIT